jgi:glycosyltransferase involved in cell wall biosynthesis
LIIPTWNRARQLERSLDRLATLTVPDEVIVVDDGGTDDTRIVCERSPLPIRYIRNERRAEGTCSLPKNIGLRAASHDHIITADPEIYFVSDVVAQLVAARIICPNTVNHDVQCIMQREDGSFDLAVGLYVNSFERAWLMHVNGWDESLPEPWGWEDIDLYDRLAYMGVPQRGIDNIAIVHQWHESRGRSTPLNEAIIRERQTATVKEIRANIDHDWGKIL